MKEKPTKFYHNVPTNTLNSCTKYYLIPPKHAQDIAKSLPKKKGEELDLHRERLDHMRGRLNLMGGRLD